MTTSFASLAAELILERGPQPLDQLHAIALERGVTRARSSSSLRQSMSGRGFLLRPDGRYDSASRVLQGCCFTTRPRRPTRDGVLWLNRDLDPLLALAMTRLPLKSGGTVGPGAGSAPTWVGPSGWLPEVPPGELLVFSWDGAVLEVGPGDTVPDLDSAVVADVRALLADHASRRHRDRWPQHPTPPLTAVVLSALLEDPLLFRRPLPPLSALLPLPEDLRPLMDDLPRRESEGYAVLQLALPCRVHRELSRRADLLGDHLPDYAAMLLGAAADRVLPAERPRYVTYEDLEYDNVVEPARWRR